MQQYITTLPIYAGRENPTLSVSEEQISNLISSLAFKTSEKPKNTPNGYLGLTCSDMQNNIYYSFFLNPVDKSLILLDFTTKSPTWKTSTNVNLYINEINLLFDLKIKAEDTFPELNTKSKGQNNMATAEVIPPFHLEAGYWNWDTTYTSKLNIAEYNNCYNYAVSLRTNSFAQPGKGASFVRNTNYIPLNCYPSDTNNIYNFNATVNQYSIADGLSPAIASIDDIQNTLYSYVALITAVVDIDGSFDFHWAKLSYDDSVPNSKTYQWTHKAGQTNAATLGKSFTNFNDNNVVLQNALPELIAYRYGTINIISYYIVSTANVIIH